MNSIHDMTLDELRAAPVLKTSDDRADRYIKAGAVVALPREDDYRQEDSGYPCMHLAIADADGKVWLYKPDHADVLNMVGDGFAVDILQTSKLASVYR